MRLPPVLAVILLIGAAASGCSASSEDTGDSAYSFRAIADLRAAAAHLSVLEPRTLIDALPNRRVQVDTGTEVVTSSFSDLVVTGRVLTVAPDEGRDYSPADPRMIGNEEEAVRTVDFDDPAADERSALVTVKVGWSVGEAVGDTVTFRLGVPMNTDAKKFLAGVQAMGDVAVLLDQIEDGRHQGDYYPILNYGALGQVHPDGTLEFPGLAGDGDLVAGLDTLDELRGQASATRRDVPDRGR